MVKRHASPGNPGGALRMCAFASLVLPLLFVPTPELLAQGAPGQGGGPGLVNRSDDPLLAPFRWREIGPASMGGRVDDIQVVEANPSTYYVAFATAGVWKTENNGTTFDPVFDEYPTASVGAMGLFQPDPDILWVGTGEQNNRQSSSFGDGVYRSTDAGRTFQHVGLRETQSIARIVVHPTDPDLAHVCAVGRLFGPNPERGVFRTTDGGASWQHTLFVDDDTGCNDLVIDPSDPAILYASTYQRRRTAWGFNGGGPGSGLWRSTDGGTTWARIDIPELDGIHLGRIALDVHRANPRIVYAQIEALSPQGGGGGQQAQQREPDPTRSGVWRSDDGGTTWGIRSNHNIRPMYFSQLKVDHSNAEWVYTAGVQFYASDNGGRNFRTVPGPGHVDHHAIWVNPADPNHLMIGSDGGLNVTYDRGRRWEFVDTKALGQFYAVAVDMRRPYYVYGGLQDNGSWGGPSQTRNNVGILNSDWFRIGGGDGFYVQVDPTDPNIIYAESQNGNVRRLDLSSGGTTTIRPRAATQNNPSTNIVPPLPQGEGLRFNWNSPIRLSPHNPSVVYVGGHRLYRSMNRGETWWASPDLTKGIDRSELSIMGVRGDQQMRSRNDGVSSFGTITTISESPAEGGVIWVGTDDGNVQVTTDGGLTWRNFSGRFPGVPDTHWVSRVEASHHDARTAYVSFDGHRSDDYRPLVFVTRDMGESWSSISSNLPGYGNVNVIKEDPENPRLLYVGTEFAFFVSLDGGEEWKRFMTGLPSVRVDDVLVHPRDGDLVLATHGRSVLIADDITPLQQMTPEVIAAEAHLFQVRPAIQWKTDITQSRYVGGQRLYQGRNPPAGTGIHYHIGEGFLAQGAANGRVTITIHDVEGQLVRTLTGPADAGLHRVQWNLRRDPPPRPPDAQGQGPQQGPPVEPGTFRVSMNVGGREYSQIIQVLEDVWLHPAR